MINKIIILCFVGVTFLFTQNLPPPKYPDSDSLEMEHNTKPTLKERPATVLLLGKFPVYFEETTLQQIIDTLKVGQITQQGDAGDDIYWLCYTDPNPSSPQRLWIISDAEMACEKHCVSGVVIQSINEKSISNQGSPKLPTAFRFASVDKGVHIGITKKELINILGQPSASRKNWWRYLYEGKLAHKNSNLQDEAGESTEDSSLFVKIVAGKIIVLSAWKVTVD